MVSWPAWQQLGLNEMDKVASLRALVKAVETGSFAEAGRQLRLSLAAASQPDQSSRQTERERSDILVATREQRGGVARCCIRGRGVALIPSFIASDALEKGSPARCSRIIAPLPWRSM